MAIELVLVPKPPTLVFRTQVTSLSRLEILQPEGGKVEDVNPSLIGGDPGVFTTTETLFGLLVQPPAVTKQE
jgi:hypothetical protein